MTADSQNHQVPSFTAGVLTPSKIEHVLSNQGGYLDVMLEAASAAGIAARKGEPDAGQNWLGMVGMIYGANPAKGRRAISEAAADTLPEQPFFEFIVMASKTFPPPEKTAPTSVMTMPHAVVVAEAIGTRQAAASQPITVQPNA